MSPGLGSGLRSTALESKPVSKSETVVASKPESVDAHNEVAGPKTSCGVQPARASSARVALLERATKQGRADNGTAVLREGHACS